MSEQTQFNWSYVLDEPTSILVVDDDPILREFASVYLSSPLATVETVPDGGTALERMLKSRFDLVLVDIEMPGIDGFELVKRVRANESLRHLPIVMLTGREDIESIDRAYNLGATAFVTKPVNWRELSYQLRYIIRASRMEAAAPAMRASTDESDALRHISHEVCDAVNAIIACASLIAEGCRSDASHLAHAENIIALGQELLREFHHATEPTGAPVKPDHDLYQLAGSRDEAHNCGVGLGHTSRSAA
jgi:CheY-like chemotaxis protein